MLLNSFAGRLRAEADVDGTCDEVYAAVSEPSFISRSTPFVRQVVEGAMHVVMGLMRERFVNAVVTELGDAAG